MKTISSLLRNDMKKLIWIFLVGVICSCGSNGSYTEEPNGGRTGDDSVAVDDSTVIEIEAEPLTAELRPVLTDGKRWTLMKRISTSENEIVGEIEIVCEVAGDTVAYDKGCKLIKRTDPYRVDSLIWYEDEGNLYDVNYLFGSNQSDKYEKGLTLAYSFYPEENSDSDRFTVLSKGTIVCCGKMRRAIKVYNRRVPGWAEYWIEGIGPVYGSCLEIQLYFPPNGTARYYEIQKCYDGDELIFDIDDFKPETYKEEVRFVEDYDKWYDF